MGERLGPCNAKIILKTWFPFASCNSLVPHFDPYPSIPQIPNSAVAALQWFHPNTQNHQPCGFGWMKRITALHVPNPNPSKSVRIFCQAMCCLPNALVPATQKQRCLWNGRLFLVTCAFEVSTNNWGLLQFCPNKQRTTEQPAEISSLPHRPSHCTHHL